MALPADDFLYYYKAPLTGAAAVSQVEPVAPWTAQLTAGTDPVTNSIGYTTDAGSLDPDSFPNGQQIDALYWSTLVGLGFLGLISDNPRQPLIGKWLSVGEQAWQITVLTYGGTAVRTPLGVVPQSPFADGQTYTVGLHEEDPYPEPEEQYWNASLNVGSWSDRLGYRSGNGALSPVSFDFDDTTYTVTQLYHDQSLSTIRLFAGSASDLQLLWFKFGNLPATQASFVASTTRIEFDDDDTGYDDTWTSGDTITVQAFNYNPDA